MPSVPNTEGMSSTIQFIASVAPPARDEDETPGTIPPEAMLLVDSAAGIAERLASRDRQLHFTATGAELRTLDGTLLRRLSIMDAIDVMCGLEDVD